MSNQSTEKQKSQPSNIEWIEDLEFFEKKAGRRYLVDLSKTIYPITTFRSRGYEHILKEEYTPPEWQRDFLEIFRTVNSTFRKYEETSLASIPEIRINTEEILQYVKSFGKLSHREHIEIMEKQNQMSDQIKELMEENKHLQELLDEKYPASSFLRLNLAVFLLSSLTLIAWFGFSIPIIHPMISIPILGASLAFSILSFLRIKWTNT
jgi:hypothetical protein